MALLPADPKQQKAIFTIIGAVAVFYGYWTFVHAGRVETLETEQARLTALSESNQRARVTGLRGADELQERALEYERHVRRLEELIPASEEVAELVNTVQLSARELGVTVVDLSPQPDEPGQHYTRHSYALEIVGDYHDIGEFMAMIASGTRIITPVRVTVARYDEGQGSVGNFEAPMQVTFEIETFILPDPSALQAQLGPEGAEQGGV